MPPRGISSQLVSDSASLTFDENVYSLDVVQRAAIKFTGLACIAISKPSTGSISVAIDTFHDAGIAADELGKVFVNEVLDGALRARIASETAAERNLILSYTFSRSKLASD
jgi:His-Xaa-Ser system protein HxsD